MLLKSTKALVIEDLLLSLLETQTKTEGIFDIKNDRFPCARALSGTFQAHQAFLNA